MQRAEIFEISPLGIQEFNNFTLQINEFLPKYGIEIKREGILKRLLKITEELKLGMKFYHTAAEIISHLPSLLYTKNDIIAAIGTTLAKFVLSQDSLSIRKIALFFNISFSCIQYHIKHKIADKFNIPFTSLLDSETTITKFVNSQLLRSDNHKITQEKKDKSHEKYIINDYLSVHLIDGKTVIYVNEKDFLHCKYLLCNVSSKNIDFLQDIHSIDELERFLDNSMERNSTKKDLNISSREEFWGHCSNLETWARHNYDTRILHRNLAFPLLKQLTKAGDLKAKRVFKEEIVKRFLSGSETIIQFLLEERYLEFLDSTEFDFLLRALIEGSFRIAPGSMLTLFNYAIEHYEGLDFTYIFEKSC